MLISQTGRGDLNECDLAAHLLDRSQSTGSKQSRLGLWLATALAKLLPGTRKPWHAARLWALTNAGSKACSKGASANWIQDLQEEGRLAC